MELHSLGCTSSGLHVRFLPHPLLDYCLDTYCAEVARVYGAAESWETVAWMSSTIGAGTWAGVIILGPFWSVIGHVQLQFLALAIMLTAFSGSLAVTNPTNKSLAIALSFLAGFPDGIIENQGAALIQLVAPEGKLGTYLGISNGLRTTIGAIGASIYTTILASKFERSCPGRTTDQSFVDKVPIERQRHITPAALGAGLPQSSIPDLFQALATNNPNATLAVPGMTPEIAQAVQQAALVAITKAYQYIHLSSISFGCIAIAAAIYLKPLDHLMTSHTPTRVAHNTREAKEAIVEITEEKPKTEHVA